MIYWTALLLGIGGSLHCLGMCGPIVLALPSNAGAMKTIGLYHTGRIMVYALLGIFSGFVGQVFALASLQQFASIMAGVIILLIVTLKYFFNNPASKSLYNLVLKLKKYFQKIPVFQGKTQFLAMGIVNGLLPCGMVYMALAASISTGSLPGGILFMAIFGLGTFPAMAALAIFRNYVPIKTMKYAPLIVSFFTITVAILFILRGLNLGIPYISPAISLGGEVKCH